MVTGNYIIGGGQGVLLWTLDWTNATVSGNTLYDPNATGDAPPTQVLFQDPDPSAGWTWGDNLHYRDPASQAWNYGGLRTLSGWQSATGLGATDEGLATAPASPWVFVRPNAYESGRGHVVVYNWNGESTISVDVCSILADGDSYEVRSVLRLDSVLVSGTHTDGVALTIPMTAITPTQPVGSGFTAPAATGPTFDVFLVTRTQP